MPGYARSNAHTSQVPTLEQNLPDSLAAGKHPRTTLAPLLAFNNGGAALACGTLKK